MCKHGLNIEYCAWCQGGKILPKLHFDGISSADAVYMIAREPSASIYKADKLDERRAKDEKS